MCANTEAISGKFLSINKRVEVRVISLPRAKNKFKGGVPTFECTFKVDDSSGGNSHKKF